MRTQYDTIDSMADFGIHFDHPPWRGRFDLQLICLMSVSLVINFRPQLITPNSLDLWCLSREIRRFKSRALKNGGRLWG